MSIICGEAHSVLKTIPEKSIDIIWTSPVYKDIDGYNLDKLTDIVKELYRVLKDNSLFFLNFGSLKEEKERPFKVCLKTIDCGFKLNDTIIWVKPQYSPIGGKKRLNNVFEYLFLFYKGEMPDLNRAAIGVPYKDISNAKRYNNGLNLKCRSNVWEVGYETITNKNQKLHPLRAPVRLVEDCIKLSGLKSGCLLDCFAGSCTSALAASNLGLKSMMIEKEEKYCVVGAERLNCEFIKI